MADTMVNNGAEHASTGKGADWSASGDLYTVTPSADRMNVLDQLTARLGQMDAMLSLVVHDVGNFDGMNRTLRADYLWSLEMSTRECRALVSLLSPVRGVQ